MAVKSGLGRGLGSLIPESFDSSTLVQSGETVEQIPLEQIVPDENQPRTVFDEASLAELAESIRRHGVVQPLIVRALSHGKYGIVAGERRWRASKMAGVSSVPALVRSIRQQERLEVALIENVQRVDLEPLEQAVSIERLHQQFNLGYADIAQRLGKAETTVSNIVRLLQLPPKAWRALEQHQITEGHARQVLALKDMPLKQDELVRLIVNGAWSVRQAEQFVSSVKAGHKKTSAARKRMATETPATKKLSKRYGTSVTIRRTAKGGKLEIGFNSDDDLRRLLEELAH